MQTLITTFTASSNHGVVTVRITVGRRDHSEDNERWQATINIAGAICSSDYHAVGATVEEATARLLYYVDGCLGRR